MEHDIDSFITDCSSLGGQDAEDFSVLDKPTFLEISRAMFHSEKAQSQEVREWIDMHSKES